MKIVQDTGSHFDLEDSASRALLALMMARPLFAHLATASEHGPRESPVWFLWEAETIWIIGNRRTDSFPSRIELEPRCAIGIVNFEVATGTVQHVGMRGVARLEPHDGERMVRLLSRYLGDERARWDSRFVEILDDKDYIFVRFTPENVVVRDQSYKTK